MELVNVLQIVKKIFSKKRRPKRLLKSNGEPVFIDTELKTEDITRALRKIAQEQSELPLLTVKFIRAIHPLQHPKKRKRRFLSVKLIKFDLRKFIVSFGYIFPKRYREEYIGDVLECMSELDKEGYSKPWIACLMASKFLLVLLAGLRARFESFFSKEETKTKKADN